MRHAQAWPNTFANAKRSIEGIPAGKPPSLIWWIRHSSIQRITLPKLTVWLPCLSLIGYTSGFFHGGNNGTMGFNFSRLCGYENYYGRNETMGPTRIMTVNGASAIMALIILWSVNSISGNLRLRLHSSRYHPTIPITFLLHSERRCRRSYLPWKKAFTMLIFRWRDSLKKQKNSPGTQIPFSSSPLIIPETFRHTLYCWQSRCISYSFNHCKSRRPCLFDSPGNSTTNRHLTYGLGLVRLWRKLHSLWPEPAYTFWRLDCKLL